MYCDTHMRNVIHHCYDVEMKSKYGSNIDEVIQIRAELDRYKKLQQITNELSSGLIKNIIGSISPMSPKEIETDSCIQCLLYQKQIADLINENKKLSEFYNESIKSIRGSMVES